MAHHITHKSLKKMLADMEREDTLSMKASIKKAEDPKFVDSEWRRLMRFNQKG